MSELTIVSFESETFGNSYVSELSDGPPFTVHGIALGAGDVTVGQSGIKKKWPAEELEQAANSLKGTDLVEDHENSSRGVVGRVTKSGYKQGTGVVYEAELFDEALGQKIKNGLLEVSIRGYHADVDDLEEDEETNAKIVEDIEFDNLSIVPTGASPSNTLQIGEHDELSAAELSQFTDTLDKAELAEVEPGMWVTDGDIYGITISQVQDGEVEVDIYEETDGTWRSVENVEMMDTDSLDEWDVDEDNIGAVEKDDNEEMESAMNIPMADSAQLLYNTKEKAMEAAKMMGLDGVHQHNFEGETWYMPGKDHAAFEKVMAADAEENASLITEGMTFFSTVNNSDVVVTDVSGNIVTVEVMDGEASWKEETDNIIRKLADGDWEHSGHMDQEQMAADASYSRGDWVQWDTRNSTEIGTVVGSYQEGDDLPDFRGSRGLSPEGDDILYALRMYDERDGMFHPIEGKPIGHYERSVRSAEEPANVSESYVELSESTDENVLQSVAVLKASPQIERPDEGDPRAVVHVPVTHQITTANMKAISQTIESELDMSVMSNRTDRGILFGPIEASGDGKRDFAHLHLDVIESAVDNEVGISQKSTLFAAGDDEMVVQPCYMTSDEMPADVLNEITRLLKFVTGVDANAYYDDGKLMLDTGQQALSHASLDVAEILVRRMGDANDISVDSNMFMVSDMSVSETGYHGMDEEENGRSNVDQYDVEAEDWVQWYPSDTTEEHGFAKSVSDDTVTIEVWTQNSDGEWQTDGETIEKDMEAVEPWGNFPRKQEEFADAIEDGDPRKKPADNEYAEENAQSEQLVSNEVEKGLKNKVEEHNEEHGEEDGKRVTYRMLKNVYERGMGAYNDTHREGMTQQQWSYARVNAFLYLVRNGNPENDQYTQDNDLLPEGHSKYSEEENASLMSAPSWQEGQMVEWQVNPNMKGKIVHIDREKKIIMVEVMEKTEQGMQSSGFTVTAGYSDLMPVGQEMNAVSSRDVPMQDHSADHDSNSVNSLMKQFVEEYDGSSPSLDEFVEWMEQEELNINRGEGEERRLDSQKDLQNSHEEQPHRFVDAEDEQSAELGKRYDDYPQAAVENAQMALDAKEETGNPNDCGMETGWKRARQLANGEGVTREQLGKMSSFNRHRQNSEMDSEEGRADCGWMMWKAWGGDEGVDWAQRTLDSIEEEMAYSDVDEEHMFSSREDAMEKAKELDLDGVHEMDGMWMPGSSHEEYMDAVSSNSYHGSDEEEEDEMTAGNEGDASSDSAEALQEYEMHEPNWSGTTERDWNRPDMEDFDTDDLGEIADHFLISESGFPPENYGDLKLPVVEPNGDLNVNALAAVKGGRGAGAVDGLPDEMEEDIDMMMNELANDPETFDRDWGMEENAVEAGRPAAEQIVGGVRVLSGDDLRNDDKSEESDADSLETYNIITMTDSIEEKLSELDAPVAVEQEEVEELRDKADRFEEMSENLEALRERTDILDEVDRSQVEELAEAEDPVVEESARYDELQSEAEQVAGVYAAELAEEYPAFSEDELMDKFSIEELREKFESDIGDVQDELASSDEAKPRSQDADEESLERAADRSSEDTETEELSNEVAQKQEAIRSKIFQ
jgi:hypothetical protein